jgi:undecaprenyl-diphosphatase
MHGLDKRIFMALYGVDSSRALLLVAAGFTVLGSGWTLFAFVPGLVFRRSRRLVTYLIGTLTSAAVVVYTLKALVHRQRPYQALDLRVLFFSPPTDYSFPSGHSAGSFCFAMFVVAVLVRKDAKTRGAFWFSAAALTAASGVALSRVFLGVHYPSDILGGALIGGAIGGLGGSVYLASLRRAVMKEEEKRDALHSPESDASIEERIE